MPVSLLSQYLTVPLSASFVMNSPISFRAVHYTSTIFQVFLVQRRQFFQVFLVQRRQDFLFHTF